MINLKPPFFSNLKFLIPAIQSLRPYFRVPHLGFTLIYLGVFSLFFAFFVSLLFSERGNIPLSSSDLINSYSQEKPKLLISKNNVSGNKQYILNPKIGEKVRFRYGGKKKANIKITKKLAQAAPSFIIKESNPGFTGIHINLVSSRETYSQWLLMGKMEFQELNEDFGRVVFKKATSREELRNLLKDDSYLPSSEKNVLWVILGPKDSLYYKLKNRGEYTQHGPLLRDKAIRTGWEDFKFFVDGYRKNMDIKKEYKPVQKNSEAVRNAVAVLKLNLNSKESNQTFWLELEEKKKIDIEGQKINITYDYPVKKLPFSFRFIKFSPEFYPNTKIFKDYSTIIETMNSSLGPQLQSVKYDYPIKINSYLISNPYAKMNNYKPESQKLFMNKDPGYWLKHLACFLIALGGGLLFRFRVSLEKPLGVTTDTLGGPLEAESYAKELKHVEVNENKEALVKE